MPRTPTEPLPLVAEPGHLIRRAHQRAVALFAEHHGRHITPVQYALLRPALEGDQPRVSA
jgi:hypothetical protein